MSLEVAITCALVLCDVTGEVKSAAISTPDENDYVTVDTLIQIHITNHHRVESFDMESHASTAKLYKFAESIFILNPFHLDRIGSNDWLVDEETCKLIRYDRNVQIQDIVGESGEMYLRVVKSADLRVQVHITNGARIQTLWATPKTSTRAIYEHAVGSGILDNIHQFTLCHEDKPHKTLSATPNHRLLENHLDPKSPWELRLKVAILPESQLMHWTFRKMFPKQGIVFLEISRADHHLFGKKGQFVAAVEGWTGKLDLKFVPPTIKSLVLKGRSVVVDFKHLRFTSLRELVLDFESIEGIDWLNLKGSQLEMLGLPLWFRRRFRSKDAKALKELRSQGKIQLDVINFGGTVHIVYHPTSGEYLYYV